MNRLNAMSRNMPEPTATRRAKTTASRHADGVPDQRRADALVDLPSPLPRSPGGAPKPTDRGQRLRRTSTLIGMDDQPGEIERPRFSPGSPITAVHARLLAQEPSSTWRRLVTDPLANLVDYGRTSTRPPVPLADFVMAVIAPVPVCTATATRPVATSDHHHNWEHGGIPTSSTSARSVAVTMSPNTRATGRSPAS